MVSCFGSDCVGYFAATAVGAGEVTADEATQRRGADAGRAVAASIWAKVGREPSGTGGGASPAALDRLPKPLSRADLGR